MLLGSAHAWAYVGATHEYLHAPTARAMSLLPQLTLTHLGDGGNRADKFARDVRLLTQSLQKHPDDPCSMFYLAQSYRDLEDAASVLP